MSEVRWPDFQQVFGPESVLTACGTLHELGRWWLNQRAKQLACELDSTDYWVKQPVLPSKVGACWILVVNPDATTHGLLEPAFNLPLIWLPDKPHSPNLFASLRSLADDVKGALAIDPAVTATEWGLHIYFESEPWIPTATNLGMDYPDFSELSADLIDFRSGWVALAGGLLSAARGAAANAAVWVTGCWDPDAGVTEVGGLNQKLGLAQSYFANTLGPDSDGFVLVPSANLIEANRFAAKVKGKGKFHVLQFPSPQRDPRLALGRYLALLKVRPPMDAQVEDHVAYYKAILSDAPDIAEEYYQTVLYPMVVQRCRQSLGTIEMMPTHLVTVVSPNNELVRLAVEVFGIKESLLFYTVPSDESAYTRQITDMTDVAQAAAADCGKLGCMTRLAPFSYDAGRHDYRLALGTTFRRLYDQHFGEVPPDHVAFDMISAHKIFNYAFDHAVAPPGSLMYWLDHQWFPAFRTPHPMTERFIIWRAGSEWITSTAGNE